MLIVGNLQFEVTGLPGTLDNRLWILGSRYNFLRLQKKSHLVTCLLLIKLKKRGF